MISQVKAQIAALCTNSPEIRPLILMNNLAELARDTFRLASIQTFGTDLLLRILGSVWVESEKDLLVLKWVLLLDTSTLGEGSALGCTNDGLNFGGVDQTTKICLGDEGGWEEEIFLQRGR